MTDRDRLIELLEGTAHENGGMPSFSDIADYLLANGVMVPPCKVGDVVYEIQPIRQRTQAYEVTTIKWNGHYCWFTWVLKDRKGIYGNVDGFSDNQIGKTVFLTKEEAEEKLRELNK